METKDLPNTVLMIILVGLIVGVGVITFDKFGEATKTNTIITNESFVMPKENVTVSFAYTNMTGFTRIENSTGFTHDDTNYTMALETGILTADDENNSICNTGETCYAWYSYDAFGASKVSSDNSRNAIGDVSNTWLSLIVTIIILAIILGLVIKGFGMKTR